MVGEFFGEFNVVFFCWAAAEAEVFVQFFVALLYGYKEELPRFVIELSGSGKPETCYVMSSGYYLLEL